MMRRLLRSRVLWAFLALLAAAWWGGAWLDAQGGPGALGARFGGWAVAISLPLHVSSVVGVGGEELFAMANGLIYGFWLGSLLTWTGWYAGALLLFWIGRRTTSDPGVDEGSGRIPGWLCRMPASHPGFIILSRWCLPGLGGHISTMIPGAAGVAIGRFSWCTAIGTGLPSVGWTYAGIYFFAGQA